MALVDYQDDVGKPVGAGRFYFTEAQKARLHHEFRRDNNPSKEWRQELADELEVPAKKIDMWYGATRQKKKLAMEKKAAAATGPIAAETEFTSSRPAVLPAPVLPPPHNDKKGHPAPQPEINLQLGDEIPIVPLKESAADNSNDPDVNLEKQKALFEKMDAKEIAWNFLNLAKEFTELKNMFDATEEKIKRQKPCDGLSTAVGQDDSREKLLEQSDVWVDNDPSVPKGWSTKQSKNGANKGLRKIFRDRSGKIFYSRKQAVTDMIQKKSYSSEEIRLMGSFCKPGDINRQDLEYFQHSEHRNTFNKTIEEQCGENSTEWVENSPDVPKGWKIKEINGVTMLKVPPPSNEMFLSRISAYKALIDNPVGHEDEIDVFDHYFKSHGINPEIEMRNIEGSEWKTDKYLPPGWKYTHTIREAHHRSSGYKRLLSFLTEKGTKLTSSLVALEYMSDAGFSKNDKDRLRAFINASKNNEKRKLEYLKANSKMGQSQLLHQTERRENDDQFLQPESKDTKSLTNSEPKHYEAAVHSNDSHENVMVEVDSMKRDADTNYYTHDESELLSGESYWTRFTSTEENNIYKNVIHENLKEKEMFENRYHDEIEPLVPGYVSEYDLHTNSKMEEFYPADEQLLSTDGNYVQSLDTVSFKQDLNKYERLDLDKDELEGQSKRIAEKFSVAAKCDSKNHLQISSIDDENMDPAETDTTLYKTALPESSIEQLGNNDSSFLEHYDTAQWNDESVLMINEHSRNPKIEENTHLTEHNYNFPQPSTSISLSTSNSGINLPPGPKIEHESPVRESKNKKLSVVNDTSILGKVKTETSCVDEFVKDFNRTEHIPARDGVESLVIRDQKLKSVVSVQLDVDSTEIKDLEGMGQEEDIARYHDDTNDPSWLEADDGDLDAIENQIKSENEIMSESIKEEEEINEFIQKEFAMQKEEKQREALQNASKKLKGAVKELNHRNAELRQFVTSDRVVDSNVESNSLIDQDIDNFLINDLLKSDEDDGTKTDKKYSDRSLSEEEGKRLSDMRGDLRYAPDPFLPEGWKQANYFVKRTGIETSRYMSPDGQKFTSRKLMIFFMKTKGYSQEVLDRVMEGTKCKRRAKGLAPSEETSEDPTPEVQRKKVVKERFITNLTDGNNEKEGNKRKRESKVDEKDNSHSYNADVSTNDNDEALYEGGQKKRKRGRPRKDETLEVKNEPVSEPFLRPVNNLLEKPPATDQDESTIGPKITIPRTAYKQLSVLFLKSPIPSNSELAAISKTTNVSAKDVKWWFIKIRHRVKVNKVEKEMLNNYLDSIRICHSENGFVSI